MGFDRRGMPVAVQLVGPKGSDRALLSLAMRLQAGRDASGIDFYDFRQVGEAAS
jgi:Asp-tRNA(Asn)/Glu-tRNA(Gln) amidotransferase A subunit family amidase